MKNISHTWKKHRALLALLLLCILSLSACKPRYTVKSADPMATTAEDAPQVLDFDQIHNDVLEQYSDNAMFGFVKNLDISGSNEDPREITITMDCIENVSDEAINIFLSLLVADISREAVIQDTRYTSPDHTGFGTLYDSYALTILITKEGEVFNEETIDAGEGLPYTPGYTYEILEEAIQGA